MKPQTIGRVLGIGLRIAGRYAGQQLMGTNQPSTGRGVGPVTIDARRQAPSAGRVTGRTAARATGSLARGVGGFLKPFHRVGNIVFLEVAGVFFFIFVLVFSQTMWRARGSYLRGPDHQQFLVAAALMLLFLYLSVSSFWRARRK